MDVLLTSTTRERVSSFHFFINARIIETVASLQSLFFEFQRITEGPHPPSVPSATSLKIWLVGHGIWPSPETGLPLTTQLPKSADASTSIPASPRQLQKFH
jgi:hypothetical protein